MRFKVGDKMKFVKSTIFHTDDVKIGETYKIIKIVGSDVRYQVENKEWFKEEELVRADYTYEDLKKSPIGSKITFENGAVLVKDEKNCFENVSSCRNIADLCNLKDNYSDLGKIIKIEEPTYATVYEYKPEILDDTEKRYLKGVIRPFKNKVKCIKKFVFPTGSAIIQIEIKRDNCICHMHLPPFEKNAMYKNMEDNKDYTLTELGLKE